MKDEIKALIRVINDKGFCSFDYVCNECSLNYLCDICDITDDANEVPRSTARLIACKQRLISISELHPDMLMNALL